MFDQSPLEIEFFLFAPDSPLDGQLDRAGIENNIAYALGRGIIEESMSYDDVAVNLGR